VVGEKAFTTAAFDVVSTDSPMKTNVDSHRTYTAAAAAAAAEQTFASVCEHQLTDVPRVVMESTR
jgi:hypothetical protein